MHCKSYSHFFSKKFQHICVSLDVNFNESLTNDIVSFEQLGPGLFVPVMVSYPGTPALRYKTEQQQKHPGSSCSKLTMSLVNDSLKFTSSDMQIC